MDPKLLFWTVALVLMGAVLAFAITGVRRRRRGDLAGHRRAMLSASALVALFLLGYVAKVAWLGHEQPATWAGGDRLVLRVHELCVFTMLAAGGVAGVRAFRLRATCNATRDRADPPAPEALARWHRRAGWAAVLAAAAGWLTACLVLVGMYRRAGIL